MAEVFIPVAGTGSLITGGSWTVGAIVYADSATSLASDTSFTRASAGVYSLTTLTATSGLYQSAVVSMASANASVLDKGGIPSAAATITLTGGTAIGSAAGANGVGFNLISYYQPTITSSSATAVGVALTQAGAGFDGVPSTVYIENPVLGGSVTFPGGAYSLRLRHKGSGTNAPQDTLCVEAFTSGTPAAGFGPGILFRGHDASNTAGLDNMFRVSSEWNTATAASERSILALYGRSSGGALTQFLQFMYDGSQAKIQSPSLPVVLTASPTVNTTALVLNTTATLLNAAADAYINIDSDNGATGNKLVIGHNAATSSSTALWTFLDDGSLAANVTTGLLDLSTIAAGNPVIKFTKTSDTPTTTFSAVNATNAAPIGYMEIRDGATVGYIPFYA